MAVAYVRTVSAGRCRWYIICQQTT